MRYPTCPKCAAADAVITILGRSFCVFHPDDEETEAPLTEAPRRTDVERVPAESHEVRP